jgi:DNA-binding NarL/FixJ family response regulator
MCDQAPIGKLIIGRRQGRPAMPVAIALADENLIVREGVSHVLADQPELDVVASCGDLAAVVAAIERASPAVVVTDVRMPPTKTDEGIRLAALLRDHHPGVGVVLLLDRPDPAHALALVAAGPERRACLLKGRVHDGAHKLVSAIEAVAAGGSTIDSRIVVPLVAAKLRADGSPLRRLTTGERHVLTGVAMGAPNAEIAQALGLAIGAVEERIESIFVKLGLPRCEDTSQRMRAMLEWLAGARPPVPG